jgi:hypothetical protein
MNNDTGPLSSNTELHSYLLRTAEELQRIGLNEQAESIRNAAAQGMGLSTEFLGESRIALAEALRAAGHAMPSMDRARLIAVLRQLDQTLDR